MPQNFMAVSAIFLMFSSLPMDRAAWAESPAEICRAAAERAAPVSGVPINVLLKLNRDDDNKEALAAWPWTVTIAETAVWFDTANQAKVHVFRRFQRGGRSFNIGCFQLNYAWQGSAFSSIEDMFDPDQNALHAARVLRNLKVELGDWDRAVAAYQSKSRRRGPDIRPSDAPVVGAPQYRNARPAFEDADPLIAAQSTPSGSGSLVPLGGQTGQNVLTSQVGG